MANTAVPVRIQVAGTISTALDSTSTAGTSVATGDTAVIPALGNTRQLMLGVYGTGASTITFVAGDEPPSEKAGLGNGAAQTVAVGKAYLISLPAGQYVQDDGTVQVLVGGTGPVIFTPMTIPRTV